MQNIGIDYRFDPLYNDLLLNHKECKEIEEESIKIGKQIRTEIEKKIVEKCEGKVDIVRLISAERTGLGLDSPSSSIV